MLVECRLCGISKDPDEISMTLQSRSESDGVTFFSFVKYFCQITLDEDSSLPQSVCKACKTRIEDFMCFCDKV